MRYDTSQNPLYEQFACELTDTESFGPCKTIAFISADNTELRAVVVYHGLDHRSIGISIASNTPKWCSKLVLKIIHGFPFIQMGCNRITATVRESNTKSRSLVTRLGYKQEGELKQYYSNGDSAIIYGLLKSECEWL